MPSEKRQRKKQGRQTRLAELRAQEARARLRKRIIVGAVVAGVIVLAAVVFSGGGKSKNKTVTAGKGTSTSTSTSSIRTAGTTTIRTAGTTTTTTAKGTTTTTAKAAAGPPRGTPVAAGAKLDTWACPKADGSSPRTDKFPAKPPPTRCIDPARTLVAKVTTSEGVMEYTLDAKKTPVTANNFAVLARYHYYDGTVVTRIDDSIDIFQTGSPMTQTIGDPGPGYDLPDEGTTFQYTAGDVVMARSSAGSSAGQYFVVVGPKAGAALNSQGNYITFARITTGLDVAKRIFGLFQPCAAGDNECLGGAPSKLVTITKVEIQER